MSSFTRAARRCTAAAALAVSTALALGGVASATQETHTSANPANQSPQPASNADYTGHGANTHGSYDSTRDGSASQNGKGDGQANGKPCAGCVGKADNKNPQGQYPDGSDHNAGYECDRNQGIGQSNPAHTGCTTSGATTPGDQPPPSDTGGPRGDHGSRGGPGTRGDPGARGDHGSRGDPGPRGDGGAAPVHCAGGTMATDVNHDGAIDERDCTAPTACAGGVMTTDVNHDGVVNAADCTAPAQQGQEHTCTVVGGAMSGPCEGVAGATGEQDAKVLGVAITRDPQSPAPTGSVHVLGAALARGVTALPFVGDLPRTGRGVVAWLLVALTLMAMGAVLLRASGGSDTAR